MIARYKVSGLAAGKARLLKADVLLIESITVAKSGHTTAGSSQVSWRTQGIRYTAGSALII